MSSLSGDCWVSVDGAGLPGAHGLVGVRPRGGLLGSGPPRLHIPAVITPLVPDCSQPLHAYFVLPARLQGLLFESKVVQIEGWIFVTKNND